MLLVHHQFNLLLLLHLPYLFHPIKVWDLEPLFHDSTTDYILYGSSCALVLEETSHILQKKVNCKTNDATFFFPCFLDLFMAFQMFPKGVLSPSTFIHGKSLPWKQLIFFYTFTSNLNIFLFPLISLTQKFQMFLQSTCSNFLCFTFHYGRFEFLIKFVVAKHY